jgi:hypothetical protein
MSDDAFIPPAPVGHNSGIEPSELVVDQIASVLAQFAERNAALVASANARVCTDNDSIGRAADTRAIIQAQLDTIWARAKEIAAPYSRAVETAKTRTQNFTVDLEAAAAGLTQKIADCREDQRRRAQAQRDEQDQAEALLREQAEVVNPQIDSNPVKRTAAVTAEADVPRPKPKAKASQPEPVAPVSLPAVRGDYGTRVGDTTVTTYIYKDARKLPLAVLNAPAVAKAIQSALKAYAKLHPEIKHVTASTDMATTIRRPN